MATRNRTPLYRKYRDALRSVLSRLPLAPGRRPPELVSVSLLCPDRSYAPLSTQDPDTSSRNAATVGLPPDWVDVSEEIASNVACARSKMSELARPMQKL